MIALRPVRPPVAIEQEYHRKIKKLVKEMDKSLYWWLRAEYRKAEGEITAVQDGALGDMQTKMRQLTRQWEKKYSETARQMAKWFAGEIQGYETRNLQNQFKKADLASLGFDLKFSYHSRRERAIFNSIVEQNVNLIKSIASQHLTQVKGVVLRGIETGHDLGRMTEDLRDTFGVTERRAAMIARDQTAKASNNLSRQRLLDYGVTKGTWMHTSAGKTYRDSHVEMDGEIYDIEQGCYDPDYGDYIQPGELVNCHCVCIPVIDTGKEEEETAENAKEEIVKEDNPQNEEEQEEEIIFSPASSIAGANAFAQKAFNVLADFKGLDLEVANTVNETTLATVKQFPALQDKLGFIGECHNRVQIAKANYLADLEAMMQKHGWQKGTPQYEKYLQSAARSFAGRNRISGNWYAVSHSGASGKVWGDLNGITVNNRNAKNAERMRKALKSDVAMGYHPTGCDTIKSVIDHELGHQVDRMIGLADDADFLKYYNSLSRDDIAQGLSRYALTNKREFIAEAWSEYTNNPRPRAIAKKVGEMLIKVYKHKYGGNEK